MPFAIVLAIFIGLVLLTRFTPFGQRSALLARGVPARGLILRAARTFTEMSYSGQRFEVRGLVLDVEVPGKPPYEVSVSALVPRICEAFPGATLDLRVDPVKRNNLAIVGPAGSSQWLGAATMVPGQTWARRPGVAQSRVGTVVLALIGLSLALGSVLSFVGGAHETAAPKPTPSPLPRAAPVLTPPTTAPGARRHPMCEAAARCCETLAVSSCGPFTSQTEEVCTTILLQEKKTAAKLGKRCQ